MRKVTISRAKGQAKALRKSLTFPETLVWARLKVWRKQGVAIRRQYPVGEYIADFACLKAKILIEIDGKSHNEMNLKTDREREEALAKLGFKVIRFSNDEVLSNPDQISRIIWDIITERLPNNEKI